MNEDDLLREADTAMYRAKASGRDGIAFFETTMQAEVEEALALNEVSLLRQLRQTAKIRISIDGRVRLPELMCDGVLLSPQDAAMIPLPPGTETHLDAFSSPSCLILPEEKNPK